MKNAKILSFVAGVSLLAMTFVPIKASAASAGMSLSGASQTSGTFSTVVYESADGPVSSVKLALSFSTGVSGVSYDYNAGPFTTTDPDGYHLSQGAVTGTQPVARVTFTLANPSTVTASIDTGNTIIKGTNDAKTAVVYYTVGSASADFIYNAPVSNGGGSSTGTTSSSNNSSSSVTNNKSSNTATASATSSTNSTAANNSSAATSTTTTTPEVKGDATAKSGTKTNSNKGTNTKKTSDKTSPWWGILALIVAAVAAFWAGRRYVAVRAVRKAQAEVAAAEAAAVVKPAKKQQATTVKPAKKDAKTTKKPAKKTNAKKTSKK